MNRARGDGCGRRLLGGYACARQLILLNIEFEGRLLVLLAQQRADGARLVREPIVPWATIVHLPQREHRRQLKRFLLIQRAAQPTVE
jgi:hypothetical protein